MVRENKFMLGKTKKVSYIDYGGIIWIIRKTSSGEYLNVWKKVF